MKQHLTLFSRLFFGICLSVSSSFSLQAQCVIDSLAPAEPGIYPDTLVDAQGCAFYEQDITFILPRDTMTTVFGQLLTIPFKSFEINGVAGLPLGMDWACDQDSVCFYDVSPGNPMPDTVGCIRIFGTPSIPNTYPLVVYITATLDVFGNDLVEQTTFELELEVLPCEFVGNCYTYTVSSNCEPAVLEITNNVPSNGVAGYDYSWSVTGPGGFSYVTADENPFPQMLMEDGAYVITSQAEIDTVGFVLDSVVITQVSCTDILDPADLYWILIDPSGNELVNTSANPLQNSGNMLPLNVGINNLLLDTGTYEFQVFDDDGVFGDPGCGGNGVTSVFLTIPNLNTGPVSITNGGLSVTFGLSNPIQVISCTDTFQLDSLPLAPTVMADTHQICKRDTLMLHTSSSDSLQWYLNGLPLLNANDSVYAATMAGMYTVEAINRQTLCTHSSVGFQVEVLTVPVPSIAFDGSMTMFIAAPDSAYRYDWYDAQAGFVGSGTPFQLPQSGDYFAVAVDTATGCVSGPSATIPVVISALDPLLVLPGSFQLFPNPVKDQLWVRVHMLQARPLSLHLRDLLGRSLQQHLLPAAQGLIEYSINLSQLPRGVYLIELQSQGQRELKRLIKQ